MACCRGAWSVLGLAAGCPACLTPEEGDSSVSHVPMPGLPGSNFQRQYVFKTVLVLIQSVFSTQILSRGAVYESKVIDTQDQHSVTFDVAVTSKMAPTAHMMAYYVRPDMEIVPDSMAFNVEGMFDNEVRIKATLRTYHPFESSLVFDPFSPQKGASKQWG